MSTKDISEAKDKYLAASLVAMKRAALEARRVAIATNTAIIVWKDQKIVRVTADELRKELHDQNLSNP